MSHRHRLGPSGFVEAAGGLILDEHLRLAVVHRAEHDDWSFPKGHLEQGETRRAAALREVLEETGLRCIIVSHLADIGYTNRFGQPKRVRYYAMRTGDGEFSANDEVDELRWLASSDDLDVLTYPVDRDLARQRWAVSDD